MILYIALGITILLLAHLPYLYGYGPPLDRWLALLLIVITVFASGFAELGTDYAGYSENYEGLKAIGNKWWEPGFELMALSAKAMGLPYNGFVALCVALTLLVAYHAAGSLVYSRTFFIFSLYCFQLLSSAFTRQQLAASLALLAVSYANEGRLVPFIFTSVVAASIHYSSLLFTSLVFVLFFYSRLSRISWVICVTGALVAAAALLGYYVSTDKYVGQATAYLADDFVQGMDEGQSSYIRNIFKYAFYVACALALTLAGRRRPANPGVPDPHSTFVWLTIIVSIMAVVFTIVLSPVFSRLSAYLFPLLAVMLGNIAPLRNRWSLAAYVGLSMLLPMYLYASLLPIDDYY